VLVARCAGASAQNERREGSNNSDDPTHLELLPSPTYGPTFAR